jgi:hypothetical protein
MGLPEVNINFSSLAVSAIQRSQRGIVALILVDSTKITFNSKVYTSITEIDPLDWTAGNKAYIEQAFLGVPSKVIVERVSVPVGEDVLSYNAALIRLSFKKWNYLAVPGIAGADIATVATQIKAWRDTDNRLYKAVLPNNVADHEGIVDFTTAGIVVGASTYSASQYTARIAGILAGLPLTRSATYYVLPEVDAITEHTTPDDDIDDGELILINDGEKIKIARGVNSLTTTTVSKGADFKKIKIIEGHDLVKEDITRTFNDEYVGKVNNNYDNQVLFIIATNAYLSGITGDVLDPSAVNAVGVAIEAQRAAWLAQGTDVSGLSDQEIKEKSFGSKVFLAGPLKFSDAVEDLDFNISV